MPALSNLSIRVFHNGLYSNGRPNTSQSILIDDINTGLVQQNRKQPVYVPVGGFVELPITDQVLFSYVQGSISKLLETNQVTIIVPPDGFTRIINNWSFSTNSTAPEYAGGFYTFASTDDDFSPLINFGDVNKAVGAHFFVVTGAVPVDNVQITVTGTSVNDAGVRVAADSEIITIPTGTVADSYIETSLKWNGELDIETTAGTAITCNYGFSKYHDFNNQDFKILGFEALWSSDASDSSSNIELIHHTSEGWTFNSGSTPDPPTPIASRSVDYAPEDEQRVGQGAWKRSNINAEVNGADSEGVLFRITSGSTGVGALSFRNLSLEISVELLPFGVTI